MKNSLPVKSIAIVLCAVCLTASVESAVGIWNADNFGLYSSNTNAWKENMLSNLAVLLANGSVTVYAAENLGACPPEVLDSLEESLLDSIDGYTDLSDDAWSVTILSEDGELLQGGESLDGTEYSYSLNVNYPAVSDGTSEGVLWSDYIVVTESGRMYTVLLDYFSGPYYRVDVWLQTEDISTDYDDLVSMLLEWRYRFIAILLVGLLTAIACLVYLCWSAGRKAGTNEICPGGLNRLPLDVYAAAVGFLSLLLVSELQNLYAIYETYTLTVALLGGLCIFSGALLLIGFVIALAAQIKAQGAFWWRHSICGCCLRIAGRGGNLLGRGFDRLWRGVCALFRMLPIVWQWLIAAAGMLLLAYISFALGERARFSLIIGLLAAGCLLVCFGVIGYVGYCFGKLMEAAKAMAQGDLSRKIPLTGMCGMFRDFAERLNELAGAVQIAAERQMKSERMKTELITNVSHDIRTPLTSVINYVDLLKRPHTQQEGEAYLDVLDRQSQRLKKLIDDLMDMSKASTGNVAVEITRLDAAEAVNQALGEFADKLDEAYLTPVFRYPDQPVAMLADGRLTWRVMSNILNNAVKYAMPNTRLYIDLMSLQGNTVITFKNISREQLNIGADELMERFVRGDSSRNTEGSGLGLNIAKSLMELQHGQMHLLVDGDLFKVTLILPGA